MKKLLLALSAGLAGFAATCGYAHAQTTIDQSKALAGSVTPGDTPGFPVTLSLPGSYRLTSNLTVPVGADGILITAENVTLDLNGFTIKGPGSCTKSASGYTVTCAPPSYHHGVNVNSTGLSESVVRNGTVQGFWFGVSMEHGRAHDLSVLQNKVGLSGAANLLASRISARMNETGVQTGGLVSDSWAMFNSVGFRSNSSYATLINSAASFNTVGVYQMNLNAVRAVGNTTDTSSTQNF